MTELKESVRYYDIGVLTAYEQNQHGHVNTSYAIQTVAEGQTRRYFVRKYQPQTQKAEIIFEHSIIKHLLEKNFGLVARVLRTREDPTYVQAGHGGRFYAIFDFLPGDDKYTWVNPLCSRQELQNAAAVLARFHHAVADLQPQGQRRQAPITVLLPSIADNVAQRIQQAVRQGSRQVGNTVFDAYLKTLDDIPSSIRRTLRALARQHIKRQVIHCDYHPGNLKFQGNRVTGLFDFDWSKIDARCFDVALALVYFCAAWHKDGRLELERAATFSNAYQSAAPHPLNATELQILPHMICAGNFYVLHWTISDFYSNLAGQANPHEYLLYLQHNTRLARWLQANWNALEEMANEIKNP